MRDDYVDIAQTAIHVSVCETNCWAVLVRVSFERLWLMISLSSHKCLGEVLKNDCMWVNNGAIVKRSLVESADQCLSMWKPEKLIGSDQVDPHWIPRYGRLITGGRPTNSGYALIYLCSVLYHSNHCLPFISDIHEYHWLNLLLTVLVYLQKIGFFFWDSNAGLCSLSTR